MDSLNIKERVEILDQIKNSKEPFLIWFVDNHYEVIKESISINDSFDIDYDIYRLSYQSFLKEEKGVNKEFNDRFIQDSGYIRVLLLFFAWENLISEEQKKFLNMLPSKYNETIFYNVCGFRKDKVLYSFAKIVSDATINYLQLNNSKRDKKFNDILYRMICRFFESYKFKTNSKNSIIEFSALAVALIINNIFIKEWSIILYLLLQVSLIFLGSSSMFGKFYFNDSISLSKLLIKEMNGGHKYKNRFYFYIEKYHGYFLNFKNAFALKFEDKKVESTEFEVNEIKMKDYEKKLYFDLGLSDFSDKRKSIFI